MNQLMTNPRFAQAYARLGEVRLNPRRHTAANALVHSEAVASHAGALARANSCTEAETHLLEDLGRAHDIGKITGTARPERSLDVLRDCGIDDPALLGLVRWHDTSLPWYLADKKGQPPSDKAWRRLAAEVDVRLLALFMVADRVDAPAGWRRNAPTVWFLDQARRRNMLPELTLEVPGHPSEVCAGGALVRDQDGPEVLALRVRAEGFELPKGGIEWDELPRDAAVRETIEETGLRGELVVERPLGHLDYEVGDGADRHLKRVCYFALRPTGALPPSPLPPRTKELRWLRREDLPSVPLVNHHLRRVLHDALG